MAKKPQKTTTARKPARIEFGERATEYVVPGLFRCWIPPIGSGDHDHFEPGRNAPAWGSTEWVAICRSLAKNLLPLRPDCRITLSLGSIFGAPGETESAASVLGRSRWEGRSPDGQRIIVDEPPAIESGNLGADLVATFLRPDSSFSDDSEVYGRRRYWKRARKSGLIELLNAERFDEDEEGDLQPEYELSMLFVLRTHPVLLDGSRASSDSPEDDRTPEEQRAREALLREASRALRMAHYE